MFNILKLNKIDSIINEVFDKNYNISTDLNEYEAIILRSFNMHNMEFSPNLLAVARAGAGTNNIPIEKLTDKSIVIFNAPGANSNAVKELIIASIINASRNVLQSVIWSKNIDKNLEKEKYSKLVEDGKKQFSGNEINKKVLGVIGLGNIGRLVAYSANDLGMKVLGYDSRDFLPFISSRKIKITKSMEEIFEKSDYITLHLPLTNETKNLINKETISKMKDGVILLNYSRDEIVNKKDVIDAVNSKKIKSFFCDFPSSEFQDIQNIITTPHLGASTEEAEILCAKMASEELREYLENGNILNSVNFPNLSVKRNGNRITFFANKDDNNIANIAKILSDNNIAINNISSSDNDKYMYVIVDTNNKIDEKIKLTLEKELDFKRIRFFC